MIIIIIILISIIFIIKSEILTCLEMLFVRLVYINDLIICCSYCFTTYIII